MAFWDKWGRNAAPVVDASDMAKSDSRRVPLRARSGGERRDFFRLPEAAFLGNTGVGDYPPGGLTTFLRMQHDAQIRACLTTKRLSVLSEKIVVHPHGESERAQQAAQIVEAQINNAPGGVAAILTGAMDALAMGFALGELLWDEQGNFSRVAWHDPRRFAFHGNAWGDICEIEVTDSGLKLPRSQFVLYTYQGQYGSPFGESDLTAAYRPWAQKDALRRMWLSALDRFGAPTPIARVPPTWSDDETAVLARQLGSLQNESAFVLPADVELSTLDNTGGTHEPGSAFASAVDFENREIARAILGQELTTHGGGSSGSGSLALGRVHQDVLGAWVTSLRNDLAERVLTDQIARPITLAVLGPNAPCPRIAFPNLTPSELAARQTLIESLLSGQVIAPHEAWIRQWLGVPAAAGQ